MTPSPPEARTRAKFNRLAQQTADLVREVEELSDADLAEYRKLSGWFTNTNCWWAEYWAARWLKPTVQGELRRRADIQKREAEVQT